MTSGFTHHSGTPPASDAPAVTENHLPAGGASLTAGPPATAAKYQPEVRVTNLAQEASMEWEPTVPGGGVVVGAGGPTAGAQAPIRMVLQ